MTSREHSSTTETATSDPCIFWIKGSAGTGKTTIAYSVAEDCRKHNVLGASFFCSRDDAECSNSRLIFTTIAYQLGLFNALFRDEVTRALKSNPDIGYSSEAYQLEQLIVKPLRALQGSFPPAVVVLDALDECKESNTTSTILSSLSRHVNELRPLKFLITSRPEFHINTAFKSSQLSLATQRLILHEVELGVVQDDIERYLSSMLGRIGECYGFEGIWPSPEDVHAIAQLSFGLFIFAATSVKFIEDRNYCNPRRQLEKLIRDAATSAEASSPRHRLDRLYSQVLDLAFPDVSLELSGRLKVVLGSICLLQDPLSSVALERLLCLNGVRQTLLYLHSVIIVPEDKAGMIRLLHPSFFDFITDPTRCLNPRFVVDATAQHTLLARVCLETMVQGLQRDICGIRNPSLLSSEVDDLPSRIASHIPPHLQYACRRWAWHLTNGMVSDNLLSLVEEFCSKYLLFWVEVCSLLGELRNALLALDAAQVALRVCYPIIPQYMILICSLGCGYQHHQHHTLTS
jgi:hypothetical protein